MGRRKLAAGTAISKRSPAKEKPDNRESSRNPSIQFIHMGRGKMDEVSIGKVRSHIAAQSSRKSKASGSDVSTLIKCLRLKRPSDHRLGTAPPETEPARPDLLCWAIHARSLSESTPAANGTEYARLIELRQKLQFVELLQPQLTTLTFLVFASLGQPGMKKFIWQVPRSNEMASNADQLFRPHGTHDECFFAGMVLLACSNLDALSKPTISTRTLRVQLDTINLVRQKFSQQDDAFTVHCIGAVACLANSALVCDRFKMASCSRDNSLAKVLSVLMLTWL